MWQSVTVTAAVCVTWSVSERVTGCDSAQGMGPWAGTGWAGTDRRARPLGCENFSFLVFFYFLLKKARNINRNL